MLRVFSLGDRFLPAVQNPIGDYSDREFDFVRAYILLVHAEIEHFIERRCLDVAMRARQAWTFNSEPTRTVTSLLAFAKASTVDPPRIHQLVQATVTQVVGNAATAYGNKNVFLNHGIRTENVLSLALPVGIVESDLDPAWLADMDAFGVDRGAFAHQAAAVTYLPDPFETRAKALRLMDGLGRLDAHLLHILP